MDGRTCYEGRVDGMIWYDFAVHSGTKCIRLTYAKYAGIANSDVPVYYKFNDTVDVRFVKKLCASDANSKENLLLPYRDTELDKMSENFVNVMESTRKLLDKYKDKK